jgi:phospholipase C
MNHLTQAVLAVAGPFQKIFDSPGVTHEFCNNQAITILQRDGLSQAANFLMKFRHELNYGVYWADRGWKNSGHYMFEGKGLWRFPNALEMFDLYFHQAAKHVYAGNPRQAMIYLGAAAHLVQDMCVPHHSRGKLFAGHRQYENWVKQRYSEYGIGSGGVYQEGAAARKFILGNAAVSADLMEWVDVDGREEDYRKATEIVLPLAQQTTAGLFSAFYERMYKPVCHFVHGRTEAVNLA